MIGPLKTSVGKKYIVAITGLIWAGFVFTHMLGNLLILCGAESYNKYGHAMINNPLLYPAEIFLVLALVTHVFFAIILTKENKNARPIGYALSANGEKGASFASKTMIYHGSIILFFLVYHLITFKYGAYYEVTYDGVVMRDLHRLIVEVFQDPLYVFGYVVCMILLGIHLSHGFSSLFQSLGLRHQSLTPVIEKVGLLYAFGVAIGFISQPLYVYFFAG